MQAVTESKEVAAWPLSRIAAVEALWGEGFLMPGGAEEVLRLAKPLNLRTDLSLLLVGGGVGGPARTIATTFGCWITAAEANPRLADLAETRRARWGKIAGRVNALEWMAPVPVVRTGYFDRCLALSPLRGQQPVKLLEQMAQGVKTNGQMVLLDLVADAPLDANDPEVAAWCRLDVRQPTLPSETAMGQLLKRLRFDIRVTEDVTERHVALALTGWKAAARSLELSPEGRAHAGGLEIEAELWMVRLRLLETGRIRAIRWHANKI